MFCHVDIDACFAAVLVRKHPHLRGKPLLALGMGGGCVIAASYEAKAKGVKTGMRVVEALKLCPGAVQMPSDFAETAIANREIETILGEHCPVMEEMSIDEWFLDLHSLVGGIPFDLTLWAAEIQREILRKTMLSVSVGIGPTKTIAKMASEYRKPHGVSVVELRDLERFLSDRTAEAIPGIGRQRAKHTQAHRWTTAWDVAMADTERIRQLFGKGGVELQQELRGIPVYSIVTDPAPPQSISRCRSFRPTQQREVVWAHLLQHLSYCVLKMRKQGLAARGINFWLRNGDYKHSGVQQRLPQLMDTEEVMLPYVKTCFDSLWRPHSSCTQVGFGLWDLCDQTAVQFSLFRDPTDKLREGLVQASLDALRAEYGRDVVVRGSALSLKKTKKDHLDLAVFE